MTRKRARLPVLSNPKLNLIKLVVNTAFADSIILQDFELLNSKFNPTKPKVNTEFSGT